MSDKQETIADIIAEKRRRADEIERDCAEKMKRGEMTSDCEKALGEKGGAK